VVSFPPSASVVADNRRIKKWDLTPLISALDNQLIPVVYGDVIFDSRLGGTILSTEDLFVYLALKLKPRMILLAGEDQGVWEDYPACRKLIPEISPTVYPSLVEKITSSEAPDVTGGMQEKVKQMLKLIQEIPDLEVVIFSGKEKGNLIKAFNGEAFGTRIIS
jgi:isopentenyl phosphate kinase